MAVSGKELDDIENKIGQLGEEFFFDTMSSVGIAVLEDQLNFKTTGDSIEGKREQLEARWKTAGKCDLELLKIIANSWVDSEIKISFEDAVIKIIFETALKMPDNNKGLTFSIEEAKPAHLPISYAFNFSSNSTVKIHKGLSFKAKQTINLLNMPGSFLIENDEYGLFRTAFTYSSKNKFIKIVPDSIYRIIDNKGNVTLEKTDKTGIPGNGILKKIRGRLDFINLVSFPQIIEIIK
ncbi:hypothetical protein [Psychrilyobacter sp.]|uniref:hypothetical protein n=1 Tax=Psychrilyobacter sp. TaxID=2586924 RepID=UPI003C7936E4